MLSALSTNSEISNCTSWVSLHTRRISYCVELLNDLLMLISLTSYGVSTYVSRSGITEKAKVSIADSQHNHNTLLQGTATSVSCTGYNDLLDSYNIKDACTFTDGVNEMYNNYMCASSDRTLAYSLSIANDVVKNSADFHGDFEDNRFVNLIHLADVHLWKRKNIAQQRIIE